MADDFSLDSHRRVYRVMTDLLALGHAVDLITVMDALQKRRELDAIGGASYLAFLTEGIPRNPNIESYVRIIKDKSLLRQMLSVFTEGMALASDQSEPATDVLNTVEARLAEIADSAIQRGLSNIPEIVANSFGSIDALYEQGREVTGLATHYIEFDKMTSGLQNSELVIIAARPSMGKTAWAINIAQNCGGEGRTRWWRCFRWRCRRRALLRRMLASQAKVGERKLQTGFMPREDQSKLSGAGTIDGVEGVHRRHAGDFAGGDAGQGAAAEAAGRADGPDGGRLSAADDGVAAGQGSASLRTGRRRLRRFRGG